MKRLRRAVVVAFHKYTPFGGEFYEPLLDFFLQNMRNYRDEYDMLYLIDSTWEIDPHKLDGLNATILRVSPHLRYYDAYKEVLSQIKEPLVLFMDNDMVVYRKDIIDTTFKRLEADYDVVSIYDTIGEKTFKELNGKSKFCPYWFATGTAMLKDYTKCEWGPNMPKHETLGRLTELMLREEIKPFEQEEDKSNILFDGTKDGEKSKNLGYYHIRAGSTPAYLLATHAYGDMVTYDAYLRNQPIMELLRQVAWYESMGGHPYRSRILADLGIPLSEWIIYMSKFYAYHGLV